MDNAAEFNETWLAQAFHIYCSIPVLIKLLWMPYDKCNHVFNGGDWYDWFIRLDAAPLSIPMASKTFTQMIQNLGNFTKNSHVNPFYPTHNMQKMYLAGHTGHIGLTDNYKLDGSSLLKPSICRLPCYTL